MLSYQKIYSRFVLDLFVTWWERDLKRLSPNLEIITENYQQKGDNALFYFLKWLKYLFNQGFDLNQKIWNIFPLNLVLAVDLEGFRRLRISFSINRRISVSKTLFVLSSFRVSVVFSKNVEFFFFSQELEIFSFFS